MAGDKGWHAAPRVRPSPRRPTTGLTHATPTNGWPPSPRLHTRKVSLRGASGLGCGRRGAHTTLQPNHLEPCLVLFTPPCKNCHHPNTPPCPLSPPPPGTVVQPSPPACTLAPTCIVSLLGVDCVGDEVLQVVGDGALSHLRGNSGRGGSSWDVGVARGAQRTSGQQMWVRRGCRAGGPAVCRSSTGQDPPGPPPTPPPPHPNSRMITTPTPPPPTPTPPHVGDDPSPHPHPPW